MLLTGDIGGTKTVLALFSSLQQGREEPVHERRYASERYSSLEEIIELFLHDIGVQPVAACFGVAGPVQDGQSQITNLPWSIKAEKICSRFNIPQVTLLNDLEAVALAVPHLYEQDLAILNAGHVAPQGNIAVVAPGTGLGTAFLVWTESGYKACPGEGGHTTFAPRTPLQVELLNFLHRRYNHVSFERVCSGSHLPGIYEFFLESGLYEEPGWLQDQLMTTRDKTPIIVANGLKNKAAICTATVDMFVATLGTMISNIAVSFLPTGGMYLGGGIPPRILSRLQQPDFLQAVTDKGRLSAFCAQLPINVIVNPKTGLYGAAWHGAWLLRSKS